MELLVRGALREYGELQGPVGLLAPEEQRVPEVLLVSEGQPARGELPEFGEPQVLGARRDLEELPEFGEPRGLVGLQVLVVRLGYEERPGLGELLGCGEPRVSEELLGLGEPRAREERPGRGGLLGLEEQLVPVERPGIGEQLGPEEQQVLVELPGFEELRARGALLVLGGRRV